MYSIAPVGPVAMLRNGKDLRAAIEFAGIGGAVASDHTAALTPEDFSFAINPESPSYDSSQWKLPCCAALGLTRERFRIVLATVRAVLQSRLLAAGQHSNIVEKGCCSGVDLMIDLLKHFTVQYEKEEVRESEAPETVMPSSITGNIEVLVSDAPVDVLIARAAWRVFATEVDTGALFGRNIVSRNEFNLEEWREQEVEWISKVCGDLLLRLPRFTSTSEDHASPLFPKACFFFATVQKIQNYFGDCLRSEKFTPFEDRAAFSRLEALLGINECAAALTRELSMDENHDENIWDQSFCENLMRKLLSADLEEMMVNGKACETVLNPNVDPCYIDARRLNLGSEKVMLRFLAELKVEEGDLCLPRLSRQSCCGRGSELGDSARMVGDSQEELRLTYAEYTTDRRRRSEELCTPVWKEIEKQPTSGGSHNFNGLKLMAANMVFDRDHDLLEQLCGDLPGIRVGPATVMVVVLDALLPIMDALSVVCVKNDERNTPLCDAVFVNDPQTSSLRVDKYFMQEALVQAFGNETRIAKTTCVRSTEDALEAICAGKVNFPLILKPRRGAGSESLFYCTNEHSLIRAIRTCFLGKVTTQFVPPDEVCLQEYLSGQEYVVNVVSFEGSHVVADVWLSKKRRKLVFSNRLSKNDEHRLKESGNEQGTEPFFSMSIVYDRIDFVRSAGRQVSCLKTPKGSTPEEVTSCVVEYVLRALDAVHHRMGPSHTEIIVVEEMDYNSGEIMLVPCLVEVNGRAVGDVPRCHSLLGYDQMYLMAYMARMGGGRLRANPELWPPPGVPQRYDPDTFVNIPARSVPRARHCTVVFTVCPFSPEVSVLNYGGIMYITNGGKLFKKLMEEGSGSSSAAIPQYAHNYPFSTFVSFTRDIVPMEPPESGGIPTVRPTIDVFTCPLAVILEDSTEVENDDASRSSPAIERDVIILRLMDVGYLPPDDGNAARAVDMEEEIYREEGNFLDVLGPASDVLQRTQNFFRSGFPPPPGSILSLLQSPEDLMALGKIRVKPSAIPRFQDFLNDFRLYPPLGGDCSSDGQSGEVSIVLEAQKEYLKLQKVYNAELRKFNESVKTYHEKLSKAWFDELGAGVRPPPLFVPFSVFDSLRKLGAGRFLVL